MTDEEKAAAATAESEAARAKEASAKKHRLGRTEERRELAVEHGLTLPDGYDDWTKKAFKEAMRLRLAAGNGKGKGSEEITDPKVAKLLEENAALLAEKESARAYKKNSEIDKAINAVIIKTNAQPYAIHVYKVARKIEISDDLKTIKVRNLDGSPIFVAHGVKEKTLEEDFADFISQPEYEGLKQAAKNISGGSGAHGSTQVSLGQTSGLVYKSS